MLFLLFWRFFAFKFLQVSTYLKYTPVTNIEHPFQSTPNNTLAVPNTHSLSLLSSHTHALYYNISPHPLHYCLFTLFHLGSLQISHWVRNWLFRKVHTRQFQSASTAVTVLARAKGSSTSSGSESFPPSASSSLSLPAKKLCCEKNCNKKFYGTDIKQTHLLWWLFDVLIFITTICKTLVHS